MPAVFPFIEPPLILKKLLLYIAPPICALLLVNTAPPKVIDAVE